MNTKASDWSQSSNNFATRFAHLIGHDLVLLPLIFLYIGVEVYYNLYLLDHLPYLVDAKDIERIDMFGRMLASTGFLLILLRLFRLNIILSLLMAFGMYFGLEYGTQKVLRELPASAKLGGYYVAAYKTSLLTGGVVNPKLIRTQADFSQWTQRYREIIYRNSAENSKQLKIRGPGAEVWSSLTAPPIENTEKLLILNSAILLFANDMQDISKGGISASVHLTSDEKDILWARYSAGMEKLAKYRFNKLAVDKYKSTELFSGIPQLNITPMFGSQMPMRMQRNDFDTFINEKLANYARNLQLTEENIENLLSIGKINASVYTPPIAMSLSLLSVTLNIAMLLATLIVAAVPYIKTHFAKTISTALTVFLVMIAYLAPNSYFIQSTYLQSIENNMKSHFENSHNKLLGQFWVRSISLEAALLKTLRRSNDTSNSSGTLQGAETTNTNLKKYGM